MVSSSVDGPMLPEPGSCENSENLGSALQPLFNALTLSPKEPRSVRVVAVALDERLGHQLGELDGLRIAFHGGDDGALEQEVP